MALTCTIGELESLLLGKYPAEDAEDWDRTGLLVGDPLAPVEGVAVALDPTLPALLQAREAGANVLLTHHPAFLHAPERFLPGASVAQEPGALVVATLQQGVALMNFHTALDANEEGLKALPRVLGLTYLRTVLPRAGYSETGRGYGALCALPAEMDVLSLSDLARRCKEVLGGAPRVWGDMHAKVRQVVTAQGSAGFLAADALAIGADCLICGEVKYHDALAFSQAGMALIEVGHDRSELPLVHVLGETLRDAGIENVVELEQTDNWHCL